MTVVIFFACLDLEQKSSFMDGHYLVDFSEQNNARPWKIPLGLMVNFVLPIKLKLANILLKNQSFGLHYPLKGGCK